MQTVSRLPYMPQLDGLRAFAVSAVLVHHLMPSEALPGFAQSMNWGLWGVRLFFVLSGFLITGLLLQALKAGGDDVDRGALMKQFYVRRALRIFPIYYLVLALAAVLRPPDVPEQLPWLATYTYNFWISYLGWFPGYFAHFWSLCVEEQFYLLWPWVVVFASRRHVVAAALLMVAAAPVFRAAALAYDFNPVAYFTLTPSSLDALGLGALLALCTHGGPAAARLERQLRAFAVPAAAAGLVVCAFFRVVADVLYETFVALAFVWLVAGASCGFGGIARSLLQAQPVVYIGRISYGIYVYHLLLHDFWKLDAASLGGSGVLGNLLVFAIYVAATVAIATISWFAIERPLNRLKERWGNAAARSAPRPRTA